jgi:putative transcriptional regulator
VNHQNRGRHNPAATPTPVAILAAREAAGLTQTAAADVIWSTLRSWQAWESGERRMHPGLMRLFRLLTRQERLR